MTWSIIGQVISQQSTQGSGQLTSKPAPTTAQSL